MLLWSKQMTGDRVGEARARSMTESFLAQAGHHMMIGQAQYRRFRRAVSLISGRAEARFAQQQASCRCAMPRGLSPHLCALCSAARRRAGMCVLSLVRGRGRREPMRCGKETCCGGGIDEDEAGLVYSTSGMRCTRAVCACLIRWSWPILAQWHPCFQLCRLLFGSCRRRIEEPVISHEQRDVRQGFCWRDRPVARQRQELL